MVKVTTPDFNVGIKHIPLEYAQGNGPNLQPIAAGLSDMANSFMRVQAEQKQKADQMNRFKALSSLGDFEVQSKLRAKELIDNSAPDDTKIADTVINSQIAYENEFVKTLPEELQPEFKMRADSIRGGIALDAHDAQDKLNTAYYRDDIKSNQNNGVMDIQKNPDALEKWKADIDARIDASGLSDSEKYFAKKENARLLETAGYGATVKQKKLSAAQYTNDLGTAATRAAQQLGISPVDLLTVISFETGGTFNVNQKGGAGGRYMGLIQFGPEEQRKYGIHEGMSVGEQMDAVVNFLQDRGFKPGMTIYDLYSTINAGSPGHYNASDAHNGGTPGTVADKVRTQMGDHRAKAEALLGGKFEVPDTIDNDPRFSNVLYEDRIALQRDADTAVNQELAAMAAERKAQLSSLQNDLYVGLLDGTKGQKDIEDGRAAGWLSDYADINKAQEILDKKTKDTSDLKDFMTKVSRGYVLDPQDQSNKKNMDLLFNMDNGEEKLQSMDQGYLTGSLSPTFAQTGMLPPKAVDTFRTLLQSSDGRRMKYAAEALNILEEQNPSAYIAQVPEAVRNKADQWEVLRYTMGDEAAIEQMKDNPSAEIRQARIDLREKAKKELDSPDNTSINFPAVLDSFGADQASVGTKARVMENDWRGLVLTNAEKGMSLEKANELAITQLKRKWAVSNIDGKSTLMRNAPELYYPQIAGSHEWMTTQARGEFGLAPDEQIALVSDATTEADISAGRPPSYLVMIGKDDVWAPAYRYPNPASMAEKSMHDVQDPQRDKIMQRIYFQPSEEDKALHDKAATVKNLKTQLRVLESQQQGMRAGHIYSPGALIEQKRLQEQLQAAEQDLGTQTNKAQEQYMTPAQQQLQEAIRQFEPLNQEFQSYPDPAETWPKAQEWEMLYNRIEQLKAQVQQEVQVKRQGVNNATH